MKNWEIKFGIIFAALVLLGAAWGIWYSEGAQDRCNDQGGFYDGKRCIQTK